jgi:DNA integrity scanning protein DisA with diadenylate cyclase activity
MLDLLPVQAMDLVDTTLVWLLIWAGIVWLRSNPARLALAGLAMLGVVYLVARQLGLVMMTWILQGFFAVSVLVAVVVFQQELRRLFEQIASFSPLRGRREVTGMDSIDTLVLALAKLAEQYRGALIVIPGHEPLERHLDGGVVLDARLSEPLLLSLFDPHSPGHDGAVVLDGDRGTRHAAALGLSERTDALCIVVSEERGTVSVAYEGRIETMIAAQDAGQRVRRFIAELSPEAGAPGRKAALRMFGRWREALLALPLAAGLWFLVVPGTSEVVSERDVPVKVTGLPSGLEVEGLDPATVRVRLAGRRLDLFLLDPSKLYVRVDAILVDLGRRTFRLDEENVVRPDGLNVLAVEPDSVKLDLRRVARAPDPPPSEQDDGRHD